MVGRRRAARAQQRREPGPRRRALDPLVDPRPDRVQLDEPLEQRRLLRQPARGPLVEVVVAVDQARRGEQPARVDPLALAARRGPGPTATIRLPSMTTCPSRCTVAVDRRDRAAARGSCAAASRDRVEDLLVARAAAEVAGERLADLGVASATGCAPAGRAWRRSGPACRSRTARRRPRGTPPAPGAARPRRRALDGHDRAPLGLPRRDQARAHEHAVEVDRARAALALLARVLGARAAAAARAARRAATRPPRRRRPRAARR